jgi:16S rRNA (guanine527-N7)-methyltransferase
VRLSRALEAILAEGSSRILERDLSLQETDAFLQYLTLLTRWQRVHRLVGSIEPEWLIENVILDSLLFLPLLPTGVDLVADLGSGAGVPGIPLKIVRPAMKVTLIESRERRASFLATVIRELGLRECRVVAGRAEDIPRADRSYDAVVMRCAGDLTRLVPVAADLLRSGGVVVASGPPSKRGVRAHPAGLEWVEAPGVRASRAFGVYRKP